MFFFSAFQLYDYDGQIERNTDSRYTVQPLMSMQQHRSIMNSTIITAKNIFSKIVPVSGGSTECSSIGK